MKPVLVTLLMIPLVALTVLLTIVLDDVTAAHWYVAPLTVLSLTVGSYLIIDRLME